MKSYTFLLLTLAACTSSNYLLHAHEFISDDADEISSVDTQPSEAQEKTAQEQMMALSSERSRISPSKYVTFNDTPNIIRFEPNEPASEITVVAQTPTDDRTTALALLKLDENTSDRQARSFAANRKAQLLEKRALARAAFDQQAQDIQTYRALTPERRQFLLIKNEQQSQAIYQEYTKRIALLDQITTLFPEERNAATIFKKKLLNIMATDLGNRLPSNSELTSALIAARRQYPDLGQQLTTLARQLFQAMDDKNLSDFNQALTDAF